MGLAGRGALVGAALVIAAAASADQFVDGIAAQVGTDIVLASEVQRLAAPVEKQMRASGAPDAEVAKMRAEILERMIERRLLEQAIRRTEIDATDAEVDQAIDAIAAENGLDRDLVRLSVEQQGMTWESYREQIRAEIQRQKLVSGVIQSKVRIEEPQIKELYQERYNDQPSGGEEVHLRHILVPITSEDANASDKACTTARAARRRIAAGEDWNDVARDVSVVNPEVGGDVGWVHATNVAGWMSDAVAKLEPGQMSPVIPTRFGCNVLRLEERRRFEPLTYEQAKPRLYQELFEQQLGEEYTVFLEKLREQTYIERKGMYADAAPSLTEGLAD
jgi:peptidyl-prolyl cis-trans isomerase SurA